VSFSATNTNRLESGLMPFSGRLRPGMYPPDTNESASVAGPALPSIGMLWIVKGKYSK